MKPVYIKIKNIGPYAESEVDFRNLDNLFLITGDTGSGKTFIFDAMAVALYGTPAGRRGSLNQNELISDFYDGKEDVFVEFRFECDGELYKIVRYLEKKSSQKSKKLFFEKMNEKTGVFESMEKQDNQSILNVIRLSREEFSKVILLPQGQFSQLLTASSSEKATILSKIFDVSKFKAIREKVSKKMSDLSNSITSDIQKMEAISGNLSEEEMVDLAEKKEKALAEKKSEKEDADEKIIELSRKITALEHDVEDALKKKNESLRLEKLLLKKDEMKNLEENAKKCRKVLPIIPFVDGEKRSFENKALKNELLKKAEKSCKEAEIAFESARKAAEALDSLKSENESHKEKFLTRKKTYDKALELESYKKDASQKEEKLNDAKRRHDEISGLLAEKSKSVPEGKPIQSFISELSEKNSNLKVEISSLKNVFEKTFAFERNKEELSSEKEKLLSRKEKKASTEQEIREKKLRLEKLGDEVELGKIMNQAAVLAEKLKKNCPCPVCGSLEHPKLAVSENLAEIAAKEKEISICENEILGLNESLKKLELEIASIETKISQYGASNEELLKELTLKDALCGENLRKSSDLKNELCEKEELSEKIEKEIKVYAALKTEIEALEIKNQSLADEVQKENLAYEKAFSILKEFEKNFTEDELSFDADVLAKNLSAEISTLQEKISDCEKKISSIEKNLSDERANLSEKKAALKSAKESFEEAEKDYEEASFNLENRLKESDFSSKDQILQFCKNEAEIAKMEDEVSSYEQEVASVTGSLKNLENAGDFESLSREKNENAEKLSEIKEKKSLLDKEITVLASEKETLTQKLSLLKEYSASIADKNKKAKVLKYLDDKLNGKVPFELWALGAYFGEVIQFASRRFYRFSRGQYKFLLSDKNTGQGKKGLEILVEDSHNGKRREVNSLSGGETFEASISLALAITDKVQSHGAVVLDSLFIDEGFGTLDSKTREIAMPILRELSENKTVGLISHVESFQDEIPSKLQVEKTESGSKITLLNY